MISQNVISYDNRVMTLKCLNNFFRSGDTRVEVSINASEDCYQWRKYGQKAILNSKFPRFFTTTLPHLYMFNIRPVIKFFFFF